MTGMHSLPAACVACDRRLRRDDRFCPGCGRPVRRPRETSETLAIDFKPKSEQELPALHPGGLFAERFVVKQQLGGGAMGLVFLVEERRQGKSYALKVLKPEFSMDRAAQTRFGREIRILARLRHPAIPQVIEWGTHKGLMYFVSQLVDGSNLAEILGQRRRLAISEAVGLVTSVAEALRCAHQAGVIHRDLKPGNIMLSESGDIFLIDFGVAKTVRTDWTKLTKTGHFVGTPQYMAPEHFSGRPVDERGDIYSLGVVLFALLTGRLPYEGKTPMSIAINVMNREPASLRKLRPSVPPWLERFVARCMEKDPSVRYWTLSELLEDLRRGAGQPTKSPQIRVRRFANGDRVSEVDGDPDGPKLIIDSLHEKTEWTRSTALLYQGNFYRLRKASPKGNMKKSWVYELVSWPADQDMGRVIDYEAELSN